MSTNSPDERPERDQRRRDGGERGDRGGHRGGPRRANDRGGYGRRDDRRDDRGGYPRRDDRSERPDRGGFRRDERRDDRRDERRDDRRDGDRGGYGRRDDRDRGRGGFRRDDRPSYGRDHRRDDRPSYRRDERRDDHRDAERRDDRRGFRRDDDRGGYGRRDDDRGSGRRDDRGGYPRRDDRSERPGRGGFRRDERRDDRRDERRDDRRDADRGGYGRRDDRDRGRGGFRRDDRPSYGRDHRRDDRPSYRRDDRSERGGERGERGGERERGGFRGRDDRGGRGPRREDRGGRPGGFRGRDDRRDDRRGGGRFRDERDRGRDRDREPIKRLPIPQEVTGEEIDKDVRQELQSLPKTLAEDVARNLVMVARLIDEDPEAAYGYSRVALRLASRVAAVREAAGFAAYASQKYAEALAEFRAARRMTGNVDLWPVMADCERGLGRPEKALDMAGAPEVHKLDKAGQVEMRLVAAGARRDMGQLDAAIVTLQSPELASNSVQPWTARLRYAYADALLAVGRESEAREWFAKAVEADRDGSTDASDRLAELDGVEFTDALDESEDASDDASRKSAQSGEDDDEA